MKYPCESKQWSFAQIGLNDVNSEILNHGLQPP